MILVYHPDGTDGMQLLCKWVFEGLNPSQTLRIGKLEWNIDIEILNQHPVGIVLLKGKKVPNQSYQKAFQVILSPIIILEIKSSWFSIKYNGEKLTVALIGLSSSKDATVKIQLVFIPSFSIWLVKVESEVLDQFRLTHKDSTLVVAVNVDFFILFWLFQAWLHSVASTGECTGK